MQVPFENFTDNREEGYWY